MIIIRETQNVFQRVESFVKFHFAHFVSNIFIDLFQLLTLHYIEWSVEYISAFQHNWQMCITSIISILLFAMTHPCDRDSGNDFSFPFRFRFLKYKKKKKKRKRKRPRTFRNLGNEKVVSTISALWHHFECIYPGENPTLTHVPTFQNAHKMTSQHCIKAWAVSTKNPLVYYCMIWT